VSPEGSIAADTLVCEARVNNFFMQKPKMLLGLNNINKQTMMKLQPNP